MRSEQVDTMLKTRESGNTQETQQLRRRITTLWGAVVALAVLLTAAAGYGYVALNKLNLQIADLPGMQATLQAAGQRLDSVETAVQGWTADWDALRARLTGLERKVAYNRELARTEAQKQAAAVEERLRTEMSAQAQAVDARLQTLESGAETERTSLAQLQEDVSAVRSEGRQEVASLRQDMTRGEQRVEELARAIDRERVGFEVAKNHTQELAPGISLRLTGTNVSYQRVKGWIWLVEDRKFLWVKDLGLQQALVFYRKDGRGPNELVITQVGDGSATGYLLLATGERQEVGGAPAAAPASGQPATGGSH